MCLFFFFSSRRRHTRLVSDWSSDVCSSDLASRWPPRGRCRARDDRWTRASWCRSRRRSYLLRYYSSVIRIFVTGGTFDKTYDEIEGQLSFTDTHLPEMLRLGRSRVEVSVRTLMMIDSLEMTDADRDVIVRNCQQCAESCIVITHGTDTMVDTAAALARAVPGETIVLTGAMIPYAFGSSDGLFNLGSALSLVQVLSPGIYIAMNGRHFEWNKVRKNRETGVFEAVS